MNRKVYEENDATEKKLAERLAELRKEKGWTQVKIADSLGISAVCYLHYEKGQRVPPLGIIVAVAKLYDVSADYLLGIAQY